MLRMESVVPDFDKPEYKQQFGKTKKLVAKLLDLSHAYDIFGKPIQGATLELLVRMMEAELSKKKPVSYTAIVASVTDLAGQIASEPILTAFFERIAVNVHRLHELTVVKPIGSFNIDDYMSWAVLEIKDAEFFIHPETKKRSVRFTIQSKSGLSHGVTFKKVYTVGHPSLEALSYKLGASGKGSTGSPRELVQLRFWGELGRRKIDGAPCITYGRWAINKQLRTYNGAIIKLRRRACHAKYTWPCVKCHAGYDVCAAGCRAVSLPIKDIKHGMLPKPTEVQPRLSLPVLHEEPRLLNSEHTGEERRPA